MEKKERIEQLVRQLNDASEAYYGARDEKMSNYEWDAAYEELQALEQESGYILPDSPTQTTGAPTAGGENREPHEYPALSLAKTKSVEDLQAWAGDREVWLSWKLDGITLVLTYDGGVLTKILTRGNGQTGTNITFMKKAIYGIPLSIQDRGHLVVRGEATISYSDFERINSVSEVEKYANPRNLTAGTLGLDSKKLSVVKERKVHFNAFTLVHCDREIVSWGERMHYLRTLGFATVESERAEKAGFLPELVARFTEKVENGEMDIPVDGLVVCFDDTAYAATGNVTGHHAVNAGLAFKWQDVSAESTLLFVEWSCAASTISPVAVFEPVQLEGTTVSRASLCNISEMKRLGIGENGKTVIEVIKANKIIPKCIGVKRAEGSFFVPEKCPVCGADTKIMEAESGTETLHCTNPDCSAKHIKKYERFVSKEGMDIDGFSVETIVKFLNAGIIADFSDIFHISAHREQIVEMDGFGEKSFANLERAVERSRDAEPVHLIYALCIPMIGIDGAKKIVNQIGFDGFLGRLEKKEGFDDIDGIGPERSGSILEWYGSEKNRARLGAVLAEVRVQKPSVTPDQQGILSKLTFVVTGSLAIFKNRNELKAYIEERGGAVTGSVSSKTDFLINNDNTSLSAKNKKAKELGIPIITEEEFSGRFM